MEVIPNLEEQFQDFAINDDDTRSSAEFTIHEVNCEEKNALGKKKP